MMQLIKELPLLAAVRRHAGRAALAVLLATSTTAPHPAFAQNVNAVICHDMFVGMKSLTTMEDVDVLSMSRHKIFGNTVERGIIRVDSREDWKIDYESVKGDPTEPLVVLLNGFIFPRENAAPFMYAMMQVAMAGGPRFNLLRYDMSGQGKTIELFKPEGPAPWYMNKREPITLENLRKELVQVVHATLERNGLPKNHPIILAGLSYGRALVTPELASQTVQVVELAGMIRSLDQYEIGGAALNTYYDWTRLLFPLARTAFDEAEASGWRRFYEKFYNDNPESVPKGVVKEWYQEASAMRTFAVSDYNTNRNVLQKVPTLQFVAEIDDPKLKVDQLKYFRDTLSRMSPSILVYVSGAPHGLVAHFGASQLIANTIASSLKTIDIGNLSDSERVIEARFENGKYELYVTTIDKLLKDVNEAQKQAKNRLKQ